MSITKKLTRKFKEENCAHCRLADKRAMKTGKPHCKFTGEPSIKNGQCMEIKR